MKSLLNLVSATLLIVLVSCTGSAQGTAKSTIDHTKIDFKDRRAVITTLENFYIADKSGSVKHKKLSMAENGAYRYINSDGEYAEWKFDLSNAEADTTFTEELLSVEIFDKFAIAKLRHVHDGAETPSYKVMLLHKIKGDWKITSISWGNGVTH